MENKTSYWRPSVAANRLKQAINKQISILDLADSLGLPYEKHGKGTVHLIDHDSCVIFTERNSFTRYSQIQANGMPVGGGPLDFYMHFTAKKYYEALHDLESHVNDYPVFEVHDTHHETHCLTPEARHRTLAGALSQRISHSPDNKAMRYVYAYLSKTRRIDPEIIQAFVDQKCLFQISNDRGKMCAFVGHDEHGLMSSICFRGTSSRCKFMGDFSGCNYARGWFFDPTFDLQQLAYSDDKPPAKPLLCFESPIEMMSYMTILKDGGFAWKGFSYLATGSVTKTQAIRETVSLYGCTEVIVAFNNDHEEELRSGRNPGKEAAEQVVEALLDEGICARVLLPGSRNDWNDTLKSSKSGELDQPIKMPPSKTEVRDKGGGHER